MLCNVIFTISCSIVCYKIIHCVNIRIALRYVTIDDNLRRIIDVGLAETRKLVFPKVERDAFLTVNLTFPLIRREIPFSPVGYVVSFVVSIVSAK